MKVKRLGAKGASAPLQLARGEVGEEWSPVCLASLPQMASSETPVLTNDGPQGKPSAVSCPLLTDLRSAAAAADSSASFCTANARGRGGLAGREGSAARS